MDEPFDIAPKLETLLLALLLRCNGVEISPELQLQTLLLTLLITFEITPHLQASQEQFNDVTGSRGQVSCPKRSVVSRTDCNC
jgi:hypothetical protein